MPVASRFSYLAGTAGTATVPAGYFVTGIAAHATNSGASFTIAPQGPDTSAGVAGPSIPVPAGVGFGLGKPTLLGQQDEMGDGTVIVFTGTDMHFVSLTAYG